MALVIAISSHVVRGHVGNGAAVPALQALGHEVWAVPTVLLAHHPGHGPVTPLPTAAAALATLLEELGDKERLGTVAAVLSGYLASAAQAAPISRLVDAVKAANPDALYCCDPVLGDDGVLYVAEEVARAVRDTLVPRADILTPNQFELGWLAGAPLRDGDDALRLARAMNARQVLVTSSEAMLRGNTGILLVKGEQAVMAENQELPDAPHGCGDLFAALHLGHLLNGLSAEKALEMATAGVFRALAYSARSGADEIDLVAVRGELPRPLALIHMRRLAGAREAGGGG